jgi:hypothetical protein
VKNKNWLIVALVAVLSLVAASCGDDGGDASADSPLVQAIVDDVMADEDPLSTDRAEVECFVTGIVGSLGEDRLRELGIAETNVPDIDELDLKSDEVDVFVDSLLDCIDTSALMAESLAEDFESDEAQCIAEQFDEDTLRVLYRSAFSGDELPDIFGQMFEFMAACDISFEG